MNATRPSQNMTMSTRKHTLFDAYVATTPARSNLFLFNKSLNGSPTEKHHQKDVFGESQRWNDKAISERGSGCCL